MHKTTMVKLRSTLLGALLAAGLILQPAGVVAAQGVGDPTNPPAAGARDARLERTWLRQQRSLDRLEFMFGHVEQRLENAQQRIDAAKAGGKDVSALQAALDAFSKAIQVAGPSLDSAKGILLSHNGFDEHGNVIDAEAAGTTVEQMSHALEAVRDTMLQPGRALRDALRAFLANNRPTTQ